MNELAVDAQLEFDDDVNEGAGEVWCISSCPVDKTLLVSCRDNGNGSETALWRIPEKAMKEDEIDYYPEDIDSITNEGAGINRNLSSDVNETMEKLDVLPQDTTGMEGNSKITILNGRVSDMLWNPNCLPRFDDEVSASGGGINFITVDHTINGSPTMTTWDIGTSSAMSVNRISVPSDERNVVINSYTVPSPPKASWDPHNTNVCAVSSGLNVAITDIRVGNVVSAMKQCHKFGVTDLDFNPNKPGVLSTCGQDALIKFWDLRYTLSSSYDNGVETNSTVSWTRQQPLRILRGGHMHCSTRVKYNSFHDQLLLSSGTDGMVNLWRVSSISSAPMFDLGNATNDDIGLDRDFGLTSAFSGLDDDEEEKVHMALKDDDYDDDDDDDDDDDKDNHHNIDESAKDNDEAEDCNAADILVSRMEMRDAVYDLEWSAADPWIYVALSYDGNIILNHVPSKEKYKILL